MLNTQKDLFPPHSGVPTEGVNLERGRCLPSLEGETLTKVFLLGGPLPTLVWAVTHT